MAKRIVEFASADGLVRYVITDDDLSKVAPEHEAQVRSALGDLSHLSLADVEPPAPTETGDSPDPTPARGKKE
jgi:hypothetical protein